MNGLLKNCLTKRPMEKKEYDSPVVFEDTELEELVEKVAYSLPHSATGSARWYGIDNMSPEARKYDVVHQWNYQNLLEFAKHIVAFQKQRDWEFFDDKEFEILEAAKKAVMDEYEQASLEISYKGGVARIDGKETPFPGGTMRIVVLPPKE